MLKWYFGANAKVLLDIVHTGFKLVCAHFIAERLFKKSYSSLICYLIYFMLHMLYSWSTPNKIINLFF